MFLFWVVVIGLVCFAVFAFLKKNAVSGKALKEVRFKGKMMSNTTSLKQKKTRKWLVLDLGGPIDSSYDPWNDENQKIIHISTDEDSVVGSFSVADLRKLSCESKCLDWHCVTGWTYEGLKLRGISFEQLLKSCDVDMDAKKYEYVYQECADGYTTNVFREDMNGAFIALGFEGEKDILPREHGGVRLICPSLYGWKSGKWLTKIHLSKTKKDGFWELLGCHERGRHSREERFSKGKDLVPLYYPQLFVRFY